MRRQFLLFPLLTICALAGSARCHGRMVIVPDAPLIKLDAVSAYELGYAYRGQKEQAMPAGWTGDFDERTGIAAKPEGEQNGRKAFLLHPPWRGGVGYTYQQYTFALPKARRIVLRGATAMRPDIAEKSDGVTFRVLADGKKLLDVHRKDSKWAPFELDLTPLAGRTAVIRFESDCGPKDDSGWDIALWADRELLIQGYTLKPVKRPDPPPLKLTRLYSAHTGSAAPGDGFAGGATCVMDGETAVFRYSGTDGVLEYRWNLPRDGSDTFLGRLELRAKMAKDVAVEVRLANSARLDWVEPARLVESRWEKSDDEVALVERYKTGDAEAIVRVAGKMVGKSMVFEVTCDKALVTKLEAGSWGPVMRRRPIPVPYYSGQVFYLPHENIFVNGFLDWTYANSSHHDSTRAYYVPLTDGSRNPLRERIVCSAAWHFAEVLPNIPNPPSPWIGKIGDKIALDIWGGSFTDIAKSFEVLAEYGITNCIALVHVWQRSGYDNALPMHTPANADMGGDEGMRKLVETGKRLGHYVALHENYVDYYPNYDLFNEHDIAVDPSGKRINAWFNGGTRIQSFAVKPNAILPLAKTQSPEIHKRYGTNACYLDVHSAVAPWFHVDFRSSEKGPGMFSRVWDVHSELWQYERDTHGGPVFGEGNAHWYWSGRLDGAEAQFGQGWSAEKGAEAPLALEFDLLKIHPLQFNHGMGYYERWGKELGWGATPPMAALDRYRMYEIAYGHAGFMGAGTWSVLQPAWLEHHLGCGQAAVRGRPGAAQVWLDGTGSGRQGIYGGGQRRDGRLRRD